MRVPRPINQICLPVTPAQLKPARTLLRTCWWLLCALIMLVLLLFVFPRLGHAGGPRYIAGSSYFNSGTEGTPLTWTGGVVSYYTDQGNLSPILPGASADAFVADAFSRWTSVSTAYFRDPCRTTCRRRQRRQCFRQR